MALSTLAGWAGSAIITKLVYTAFSLLAKRMLPADTETDLERLKAALPKITTVMGVAEALKFKDPNANEWIQQFRLAFQAAEDVLDELAYHELKEKVRDQASGSFSSTVRPWKEKICEFFGFTISKGTLRRLREAVRNLDRAAADVGPLLQLALDVHHNFEPHREFAMTSTRETTSFLTESQVFGRETEKAEIIEWLRKPASQAHISVFCVIGVGGLGKTTLAQLIFQEINRENRFDKTVWVCVSTSFSVENITRKILEELGEESRGAESLNGLQKKLKEKIQSKKVLFVLDDVWNDEKMCDWEKLMAPLGGVQQEIKILLTTRMKSVADMVARVLTVEREYLVLGGLKEQELLLLFNKYAFHGSNPDNHMDLQEMGNQRVKMLRGSPLLAKVIGSLLNSHMDFNYWKRILNSDSLIDMEKTKDVVDVLKLSYYHLPSDLQECFRFCSIFPQDYKFDKNELVKMWMASGFIRKQHCREERPEDIGEEYFNHLLKRCFFHLLYGKLYVMHDLMHDLSRNTSSGECYRVEPNDKFVPIPITAQHVSIQASEIVRIFHLTNLRSLVISENEVSTRSAQFVLPNGSLKKTLRLLRIGDAYHAYDSCELPDEIGRLIHLRYLSIRSEKCFLPDSTYTLHHLQVLKLPHTYCRTDCSEIQTTGINNLVSLRYMDLPSGMMRNISGVHKLTSLQELTFFVGQQSGYHIDELNMLNNLRHLSINRIQNVGGDPVEAKNTNLSKKKNLISLSLNWTEGSNSDNPELIIDNLRPNSNLKELTINCYEGHISPIWMRVSPLLNLSYLELFGCPFWQDLQFLGKMRKLKKLSLFRMNEMKEVDFSFDSTRNACIFPSLEWLYFSDMPKLVSLAGLHACYGFPNLEKLEIRCCPNLIKLPAVTLSLNNFSVDNVGLDSLPNICHNSSITAPASSTPKSSIREVQIKNCPSLKLLNGFLQTKNLELQDFVKLIIQTCVNLVQLPTGAFGKFVSLKWLTIRGCPKLVAVDNQGILLPAKLLALYMGNCGELDEPLLESASGLTTLTYLSIGRNTNITRIPSSENAFASLTNLHISKCDKLVELSSMEQAHGVNPGNNSASLKISTLRIGHLPLLLIEPLRSLRCVTRLEVGDCSGMEALPEQWLLQNRSTLKELWIYEASSLRSLPGTMVRLTALENLSIYEALLLEELPELPTSLIIKEIYGPGGRLLCNTLHS